MLTLLELFFHPKLAERLSNRAKEYDTAAENLRNENLKKTTFQKVLSPIQTFKNNTNATTLSNMASRAYMLSQRATGDNIYAKDSYKYFTNKVYPKREAVVSQNKVNYATSLIPKAAR